MLNLSPKELKAIAKIKSIKGNKSMSEDAIKCSKSIRVIERK